MTAIRAMIFDLDGVITDTAKYHFQAWQALAYQLGLSLDERDHQALKGIDRMASLELILAKGSIQKTKAQKLQLADEKNQHYQSIVATMTPEDLMPGAETMFLRLKQKNLSLALASASKNASLVLNKLGISDYFDYIADAHLIKNAKPHPEIFLTSAEALGCAADECIGIEDAIAGVRAIKAAGMRAIGIGCPEQLREADQVYPSLQDMDISIRI